MRDVTLIYCLREDDVLLGLKKRGFGEGKWNGYGGKRHDAETVEEAAVRELREEAGIEAAGEDLQKIAEIEFFFADEPGWDQRVHVFLLHAWRGEPQETEEMRPQWFRIDALPLERMWIDDQYWLPRALNGERLRCSFTFGDKGARIVAHHVEKA